MLKDNHVVFFFAPRIVCGPRDGNCAEPETEFDRERFFTNLVCNEFGPREAIQKESTEKCAGEFISGGIAVMFRRL